jgi:ABC-type bacteriocin/lantibiotic exporter with double-glycine peptidase domain
LTSIKNNLIELLTRLWFQIGRRRKVQFLLLLFLMVAASFGEILSIGAILPFLSLLANPDNFINFLKQIDFYGLTIGWDYEEVLLIALMLFCFATACSALLRLLLVWANMRFSYATGADLSAEIYRKTLYQPYATHASRNSSEIINAVSRKTLDVITTLSSSITILSSFVILLSILLILFSASPLISIYVLTGVGVFYLLTIYFTRQRLFINSIIISTKSTKVIKILQEGLGGIRDVLLDGSQPFFCREYQDADWKLRLAQGNTQFIGQSPRFVIEALGMILIAFLAYRLSLAGGVESALPTLGVLALGAQRLIPVLQNLYLCWSNIQGNRNSLAEALDLLEQPMPEHYDGSLAAKVGFDRCISFDNVSFQYDESSPLVLNEINLSISKGSRIGLIGHTGSGKSTVLDLLMALLSPTKGLISVDGVAITPLNARGWQKRIAHVPQSIYLADVSIAENIAFAIPRNQIDMDRVIDAARKAKIHESISSWRLGYETLVGERGVRLSGGQRQRIGIARALYKKADVIVFDEATSALDESTEVDVMNAIGSLDRNLTLIIVAHRLSTLRDCESIIEIESGKVKNFYDFTTLVQKKALDV